MFGVNDMPIMVFFVGTDIGDAQSNFPFDSYESARSYQLDNKGTHVYQAEVMIDFTTMEKVNG